jgi:hypothetical protein
MAHQALGPGIVVRLGAERDMRPAFLCAKTLTRNRTQFLAQPV